MRRAGAFTNKLVSCLTLSGGGGLGRDIWHKTESHSQELLPLLVSLARIDNLCSCDNIGLVSLILLGCELRVLYHCTMCTRHPDLVIPYTPILI